MPSEDDSTQAASLTCAHFVEYISTTLETPFIVLDDVSCTEAATTTDPNRICFDITVVAAANSEVIPSLDDVNTLICIALLPPEVDALIADLSALPANNPFSTTSALTCDIVAASTPSPSVRQTPVPSTALSPTPVPRRSEEPAPTNAPEISTDNPTNAPTQKRATGTHVDASPFTLTYDATAGPGPSDFREAGLVTCDHVVSVIRNFFLGSQFITLESAFCNGNSITTNNDTMLIEYEVNFIFAPESVAVPTMSDIDSLIEITLSDPVVQNLYADLQGLPSSNPLSATTGVTYQVSRRILVEQIVPASFASARFSTRTLGVAMLFLFVPLFLRGKFTVVFISI